MPQQEPNTGKTKLHSDFEALPLEDKIATLLKMEAVTLSETFAYAIESPMKVVEKFGDMISDLGVKIEAGAKKAQEKAEAKKAASGQKGKQPKHPPTA